MKELEDKYDDGTITDDEMEKLLHHAHGSLYRTRRGRRCNVLFKLGLFTSIKGDLMAELLGLPAQDWIAKLIQGCNFRCGTNHNDVFLSHRNELKCTWAK